MGSVCLLSPVCVRANGWMDRVGHLLYPVEKKPAQINFPGATVMATTPLAGYWPRALNCRSIKAGKRPIGEPATLSRNYSQTQTATHTTLVKYRHFYNPNRERERIKIRRRLD